MSPTAPAATTASTFGWDTVFAMRIDDVNAAIIKAKSSPTSFSVEVDGEGGASGTFTDWQVCMGGSGKLLHLSLPIPSGQLTLSGVSTPFANATAVIEVELDFFMNTAPVPKSGASGTFHDLKVNTSNAAVQVLTVNYAGTTTDFMVKAELPGMLTTWLNQHLAVFDHIFATVNLNRHADTGNFAWLFPTASAYSYCDHTSIDDSLLAVLCMTEGRPFDHLLPTLSVAVIPASARAGFLINKTRFLQEMVLPNMAQAFQGAQVSDFAMAADGNSMELTNSALTVETQSKGTSYHTNITSMTITIVESNVVMHSTCVTTISPGIYAHCEATHSYAISLATLASGKQTLVFNEDGTPVVNNWTTKSEGIEILDALEIIIGAVATVVLSTLTAGAAFVVGAIIIGALVGLASQTPAIIGSIGQDDAPDLSLLAFNTTDTITWDDSQEFNLVSACLNDSLQLGGTYIPKA